MSIRPGGRRSIAPEMSNGRSTLEQVAPEAARALGVIEVTAWDQAGAVGLLDLTELIGRVCGSTLGLAPLTPPSAVAPGRWSTAPGDDWRSLLDLTDAERAGLRFAEQFSLDVGSITEAERDDFLRNFAERAGVVAPIIYVMDFLPRVWASLDALFGAGGAAGPPPAPAEGGIWAAVDGLIRTVPPLDALDPLTTELVRLRGARQHRCRICQSLRSRPALLAGAEDADFAAVDDHGHSHLDPLAKAALAFTDAMVWTPAHLDAGMVFALEQQTSDAQRVELVLDVARNALNKIAVALDADAPHVEEGIEIFDVDADGDLLYGLSLDAPGATGS
jgi:alkylhydroperoxidase family enzyme